MRGRRIAFACLLAASLAIGSLADWPRRRAPVVLGGYQVLAADFHTHSSMWSNGTYTPMGLVLEARREALDAFAITAHNEVVDAKLGRWFSKLIGGPVVIVGDEVQTPDTHLVAIGIERAINSRLPVADQIAEVHAQGGLAIAAHPLRRFWPGYDEAAIRALDGTEVCHPDIYFRRGAEADFEHFHLRAGKAAIGSSDFHGFGGMGECRTFVFARERTAAAVIDAIRERRTVVYGRGGKAYGDPALIELAATHPELRAATDPEVHWTRVEWAGYAAGLAGLTGLVFFSGGTDTRRRQPVSN